MDTTRRHPRTALEAFGPYRDMNVTTWEPGPTKPPRASINPPGYGRGWWACMIALSVIAVCVITITA